jgi:hypothetical protein
MSMDTEIRGSLSKRVDPYPVSADYLNEDDESNARAMKHLPAGTGRF